MGRIVHLTFCMFIHVNNTGHAELLQSSLITEVSAAAVDLSSDVPFLTGGL